MDRNDKTKYWPKIIVEIPNWSPFLDTMEFTADRIDNVKNILPSLLNCFSMFKIKCWWNPREYDLKQTVEKMP